MGTIRRRLGCSHDALWQVSACKVASSCYRLHSPLPSVHPRHCSQTMGSSSDQLPVHVQRSSRPLRSIHRVLIVIAAVLFGLSVVSIWLPVPINSVTRPFPPRIATAISRCKTLRQKPGPPHDFHDRKQSDRFVSDTRPTLLKNAKIWTGLENGTQVLHGSILLDKGIIQAVGQVHPAVLKKYKDELVTVDLKHAWVTPGYVRIHSCFVFTY